MKSFLSGFFIFVLIVVISYTFGTLIQKDNDPWVKPSPGNETPEIDVTGRWSDMRDGLFGGGQGYLHQRKNKVSGAFGDYAVKGLVSGKNIYLVFQLHGTIYYTARLELFQDLLIGKFFEAGDIEQKNGIRICFEKAAEPTF